MKKKSMYNVDRKIDSHSSALTNKAVSMFKLEIDRLGLQAANSLHLSHINAFYNAVEQWYLGGLKDILKKEYFDLCETYRKTYSKLIDLMESNAAFQNRKVLKQLLITTKMFYSQIVSGLQAYEYWFRLGDRNVKGLGKVSFFQGSIFGSEIEENEDEEE